MSQCGQGSAVTATVVGKKINKWEFFQNHYRPVQNNALFNKYEINPLIYDTENT